MKKRYLHISSSRPKGRGVTECLVKVAKERKPFPCTECDESCKTKVALTDHMTYKHGADFTCI